MTYCKEFINGIDTINFSGPSAEILKRLLIQFAYQELKKEEECVATKLSNLPTRFQENEFAKKQLGFYREKQQAIRHQLQERMRSISEEYGQHINLDAEPEIPDLPFFIKSISENFRNIKHLASTLIDAPPAIKNLQTLLYVEILSQLGKKEQEVQLQTLSLPYLHDLINQALIVYETTKDVTLRHKCQHLVQMSFYEIVRQYCNSIKAADDSGQYDSYQKFLRILRATLQKVKINESDIIDNLSDYKATDGESIADLIASVEKKLHINSAEDWCNDKKITAIKERQALFHTLRFGQEDRREYAQKTRDNLVRDLFWARNIRDMELFTQDSVTDKTFIRLVEQNYLSREVKFKNQDLHQPSSIKKEYLKLWDILQKIGNEAKNLNGVKRVAVKLLSEETKKEIKQLIRQKFQAESTIPQVLVDENGIDIDFFAIKFDEDFIESVLSTFLDNGGFGRTIDEKLMLKFLEQTPITSKLSHIQVQGKSITEIEQKLQQTGFSAVYQPGLTQIKECLAAARLPDISHLNLDSSNELLLRKLLELYSIQQDPQVQSILNDAPNLKRAFNLIKQTNFIDALKINHLDESLNHVYLRLSQLEVGQASIPVRPIIEKAKLISSSVAERQAKSDELHAAFDLGEDVASKLEAVFIKEYHAMAPTLNLSPVESTRMDVQIKEMANDMARLYERTRKAEPILTTPEQDAYFSIIQQVAQAVAPKDLGPLRFKVKHSSHGSCNVKVFDDRDHTVKKVRVEIGPVSLPYSLVKSSGSDFMFSYGGSRGIIAPFAELDEAYSGPYKKGRLFTNSRLLGVGQYGSVKEVESLLSGLNQVIKKGYVPAADGSPTFTDKSRNALRTRPITARDDTLYRIESDVLHNLSQVQENRDGATHYSIEEDKPRRAGELFSQTGTPLQYQILTGRAKGETFADTTNKQLNLYPKASLDYHNPLIREARDELTSLKEYLQLSQEIIQEAQRFEKLGFAHNDIKPENFLYKKNPDGSYQVRYIDWATGGFERLYSGDNTQPATAIFEQLFGTDLPKIIEGETRCYDSSGRYVEKTPDGIRYGINPTLQILHGARNGTLPYISPEIVLGEHRERQPQAGMHPELNTVLTNHESSMDDWALTAMLFGICNREAYFTLVKGRVVKDYVVPGVLDVDGKDPLGLKIVDKDKFNQYFSCGDDLENEEELYRKKDAVMYIPSNQREGEPLHLYRRMEKIKKSLIDSGVGGNTQELISRIDAILSQVHDAVASGRGLNKEELKNILLQAQHCIFQYENFSNPEYQIRLDQNRVLLELFNAYEKSHFTADDLSKVEVGDLKRMEILCTYPSTPEQKAKTIEILDSVINEIQFIDKFIGANKPFRHILTDCITKGQNEILIHLLSKISSPNPEFINQVKEDGLLHYAAEQGMTDVFSSLLTALTRAGASSEDLFALMMVEYGPNKTQTTSPIKWSTNTLHSAIRNNNPTQLELILEHLPKGSQYDEQIKDALHLCARLGNKTLFAQILNHYPLTPEQVLAITPSAEDISPYHLFLNDKNNLDAIPFSQLQEQPELTHRFLLTATGTHEFPILLAARDGNYSGVRTLIGLGKQIGLSKEEWSQLLTQIDAQGKNLFNFILEQSQFSVLSEIIDTIKTECESPERVLVQLLSNPHPVNPLKNFLNQEPSETQQFAILNELFDAISPDFKADELQQYRMIALLVNQEWFCEKASSVSNHAALRHLLQNEKLSTVYKQSLFKHLADKIPQESEVARKFFNELLQEVLPKSGTKIEKTSLGLPPRIVQEAARQGGNFDELLAAYIRDEEEMKHLHEELARFSQMLASQKELTEEEQSNFRAQLAELKKQNDHLTHRLEIREQQKAHFAQRREARSKDSGDIRKGLSEISQLIRGWGESMDSLTLENNQLTIKLNTLEAEAAYLQNTNELLHQEVAEAQSITATAREQINTTEANLKKAERETEDLSQQIKAITATHRLQLTDIERKNAEYHDQTTGFQEELRKEKERYSNELGELKKQFIVAESNESALRQELGLTQKELQNQLIIIDGLDKRVEALNDQNQNLQKQLLSSEQSSEEERAQLLMQLKAQHQEIEKAAGTIAATTDELISLNKKKEELQSQSEELSQDNYRLMGELNLLNDQLRTITAEQETLRQEKDFWLDKSSSLSNALNAEFAHSESLKEELTHWQTKHEELKETVTGLQKQVVGLSGDQRSLQEKIAVAREEKEQTEKLLLDNEEKLAKSQQKVLQLNDRIKQQNELHRAEKAHIDKEMEEKIQKSHVVMLQALSDKDNVQKELVHLIEQLELESTEQKQLAQKFQDTQSELTAASNRVEALEAKAEELEDLKKNRDELLNTLSQSEEKIKGLIKKLEEQQQIAEENVNASQDKLTNLQFQYEQGLTENAQNFAKEKKQLSEEKDLIVAQIQQLTDEYKKSQTANQEQVTLLMQQLQKEEDTSKELRTHAMQLQLENETIKETTRRLQADLNEEHLLSEGLKANVIEWTLKHEKLENQTAGLYDQLADLTKEQTLVQNKLAVAIEEKERAEKQLVIQEEELKKKSQKEEQLSKELQNARSEWAAASTRVNELEEKAKELKDLKQNRDELLKDLDQSKEKIVSLMKALDQQSQTAETSINAFQAKLDTLETEYQDRLAEKGQYFTQENAQLSEDKRLLVKQRNQLQDEITVLQDSSKERLALVTDLTEQLQNEMSTSKKLRDEALCLQLENKTFKEDISRFQKEAAELQVLLRAHQEELQEKEKGLAEKEMLLETTAHQLTNLQEEVTRENEDHQNKLGQLNDLTQDKEVKLQEEQTRHQEVVTKLEEQLATADSSRDLLLKSLNDTNSELKKQQAELQQLQKDVQELNGLNTELQTALQRSRSEKKETREQLVNALESQRQELDQAQLATSKALQELNSLHIQERQLAQQANRMEQENQRLLEQVVTRDQEQERLQQQLVEEKTHSASVLNQATEKHEKLEREKVEQLAQVTELLQQIAQQKGIDGFKHEIEHSKDADFLHQAAQATTIDGLPDIGLSQPEKSFLKEEALAQINEAAKERLEKLSGKTFARILDQVNKGTKSFLTQIVEVENNEGLENIFSEEQIALLKEDTYKQVVELAEKRLEKDQAAIRKIYEIIEEQSENKEFLEFIRQARENRHLSIKIPRELVQDLVDESEYQNFSEIAEGHLERLALQEPIISEKKKANILMEEKNLFYFKEKKVMKGREKDTLPQLEVEEIQPHEGATIHSTLGVYKGAHIDNNEVIRSHKVFTNGQNKVRGVALLVQDTHQVVDKSYGQFGEEDKVQIAIKQAMMFLLNYRQNPNSQKKEFFITGDGLDSHNKLYAALLFFKQNDPLLKDLVIKSSHIGCIGPKYQWHTRDKVAEELFIEEHLGPDFIQGNESNLLQKQVIESRRTLGNRYKHMMWNLKGDAEKIKDYSLDEDDTIDSKGEIRNSNRT